MLPFVRIVLLRPRNAENLGAVARALKNCGLSDWVLVAPEVEDWSGAARLAVHAEDVLAARSEAPGLLEAVADCEWVVGTTSRALRGRRRLTPREVAEQAVSRGSSGRVALVFGDERSGLSNEDLDLCHDVSLIPGAPEQPSFNLAQSVLVYAYELRMAWLAAAGRPSAPLPVAASDRELRLLERALEEALRRTGFLHPEGRHAVGDLLASLRRGRLTRKEAQLWLAALNSVVRDRLDDSGGTGD